ncbi:unnamed protein product, partial [marine sediment metagenome]
HLAGNAGSFTGFFGDYSWILGTAKNCDILVDWEELK